MDTKEQEAQDGLDFLYIEEANSNDGEGKRIKFKTSQTVEELKRVIATEAGCQDDWRSIELIAGGRELHDLGVSLASCSVYDGDTIFYIRDATTSVKPPPYTAAKELRNVFFNDLDGKTLTLNGIPLSWTVKQLREKLGVEKHVSDIVDSYRFIWSGKQLENARLLSDYGLMENCTIHIVLRLPGGVR